MIEGDQAGWVGFPFAGGDWVWKARRAAPAAKGDDVSSLGR